MGFHQTVCIDIVEICFGIANGQISSIFDSVICPPHSSGWVLSFYVLDFVLFLLLLFLETAKELLQNCNELQ